MSLRALHRAAEGLIDETRLEGALVTLLGERCRFRVLGAGARLSPAAAGFSATIHFGDQTFGLFAEAPLVAKLLRKAFGRPAGATLVSAPNTDSPLIAGALHAIIARLVRQCCATPATSIEVRTALPTNDTSAWLARALGEPFTRAFLGESPQRTNELGDGLALRLAVDDGEETFAALLFIPRPSLSTASTAAFDIARVGSVPLGLEIVLARVALSQDELALLREGDVLLLGEKRESTSRSVTLSPKGSERHFGAEWREDGTLVIRKRSMNEITETLSEAPVVVRVEVGTVELLANEWASLREGDIVSTSKRIGAPVVLRVGSVAVAEGELVDVEGEVGVRILRRAAT